MGETLYYNISQPYESTKSLKRCILACPIEVSRPSFKILNLLNQLWNERLFMRNLVVFNENLHQIHQNVIVLFFNSLEKYPKHPSIYSCVWTPTWNPNLNSLHISLVNNNDKNANKYLLSFTQLSIWNKK
jgi:hypothetical protein